MHTIILYLSDWNCLPNTNDLQIEGDFWEAICILWDWAFESISVPQSKGIGQQHPPQLNLKWEKKWNFSKRNVQATLQFNQNEQFCDFFFSQPGSGNDEWREFFFFKILIFYYHYFSFLIPLCMTTSPSPSLNTPQHPCALDWPCQPFVESL